ncbi:hypothetical protein N9L76_09945 [bacterium]|nr:hypothetical protein [bacterium]
MDDGCKVSMQIAVWWAKLYGELTQDLTQELLSKKLRLPSSSSLLFVAQNGVHARWVTRLSIASDGMST